MSTAALTAARASGFLPEGAGVLVLLSGGRDSVCLLDVAVTLAGDPSVVRALHVNYGLREDAREDEALCAELCRRLEVELSVERPQPSGGPGNLQAWARDVRYGAAARLVLHSGARVAVGHTATDQAETVLYRLAASPGRRALLGMPAQDGLLVRPLLQVTREDTAAHCAARGLAWCEDPTNAGDAFARGRVRNGLVPALTAVHPEAEANVLRTAAILREESAVLDELVEGVLANRAAVPVSELAALAPALARLVVRRLAEDALGRLVPAAARRAPEVLAMRDGALDLGDGARALVRAGVLSFSATPPLA